MSLAMVAEIKGWMAANYLSTNLFIECFLAPVETHGLRCYLKLLNYENYAPGIAPIPYTSLPESISPSYY
jgi:hypothetical protein